MRWLAIILAFCLGACATPYQAPEDPVGYAMDFAAEHTIYPRPAERPRIYVTDDIYAEFERYYGEPFPIPEEEAKLVAWYDRHNRIIFMQSGPLDLEAMAKLVHEVVHYAQDVDGKPYCIETWEEDAIRVEAKFRTEATGQKHGAQWIDWRMRPFYNRGCDF